VQIEGVLEIVDGSRIEVAAGRIAVSTTGSLIAGSVAAPFSGSLTLLLNASLHDGCSTLPAAVLEARGTLQLVSADLAGSETGPQGWVAVSASESDLTPDVNGLRITELSLGDAIGVSSDAGDEVATIAGIEGGSMHLAAPLALEHTGAISFHRLSRSISIVGAGPAHVSAFNGDGHASMTSAFYAASASPSHGRLLLHGIEHVATAALPKEGTSTAGGNRAAPYAVPAAARPPPAQPSVTLHGVELRSLGLVGGAAALRLSDPTCAFAWPASAQTISVRASTFHSLASGCFELRGCAASVRLEGSMCFAPVGHGLEIVPVDAGPASKWDVALEDLAVISPRASSDAEVAASTLDAAPACLLVDTMTMADCAVAQVSQSILRASQPLCVA